jgi:hypothetical protein
VRGRTKKLALDAGDFQDSCRLGLNLYRHRHLDVSFNEDKSKIRAGNGAENFSLLKRCVLNLVKADTTEKASVSLKRLMAGWDPVYRLKLLGVK